MKFNLQLPQIDEKASPLQDGGNTLEQELSQLIQDYHCLPQPSEEEMREADDAIPLLASAAFRQASANAFKIGTEMVEMDWDMLVRVGADGMVRLIKTVPAGIPTPPNNMRLLLNLK